MTHSAENDAPTAIYVVRKPEDMTGLCPSCYANVAALTEAVKAGAVNFCQDPAHSVTPPAKP
jgi:ActR/RegA family two-component response regulator